MPPIPADSPLGLATVALIAHERGGEDGLGHPILEQMFQRRQLERSRVVLNAAVPKIVRELLASAEEMVEWLDGMDAANEATAVLRRARKAIAETDGWDPS